MDFSEFKKKYQKQQVKECSHEVNASPMISVLVQTYQHKDYIQKCLDGILNQKTHFPFEILLGEDCSTDGTREICIAYAENYPDKIRLFLHHPDNKIKVLGITTGNFNALYNFFSAKGEFIAFCEGDDLWTDQHKLQEQVDLLRSKSALTLTYHSYIEVNEKEEPLPKDMVLKQPTRDMSREDLKRLTYHPLLSTTCFRNCLKENIPYEMTEVINMDTFLFSLLGNYGNGKFQAKLQKSFYRRHFGGVWGEKMKIFKFRSKILTYKKLNQYYSRKGEPEVAKHFLNSTRRVQKMLFYSRIKNIFLF